MIKGIKIFVLVCWFSACNKLVYAQVNADSVKQILNAGKPTAAQKINLLNILAAYYNPDSTGQALLFANEAYLLSLKENNKYLQGKSLLNLMEGYLYNDYYDQALQYGFNALDIFLKIGDKAELAECYRLLGWVFYDSENADFAMQYHQKSNQLYTEMKDEKNRGISFNAIGLVFQLKNENDSSKKYFEKALSIANKLNNNAAIAAALNNIGICENNLSNYQSAILHLDKSLAIIKTLGKPLAEAETLNQLAFSYFKLGNYTEAKSILDVSKKIIESSGSKTRKEKILDNLNISSQLNKALGNYEDAFKNLQEFITIKNEIASRAKSDAVATLKLQRESKENEEQIRLLDAQKELRSFQRNALDAGIVLLVIIGVLLYGRMRQRHREEKKLANIRQELIKKELENTVLEKDSLNDKLEYKNGELKNSALYISQRNDLIRQFVDELMLLKNDIHKEGQDKFNRFLNKFHSYLEINKEGMEFNLSADELHKDFIYNLLQKYPGLTENERRLCTQIRLNLSIKEIASLNNISIKSAEMARYRLRKHLNLQHEENLNDFLSRF